MKRAALAPFLAGFLLGAIFTAPIIAVGQVVTYPSLGSSLGTFVVGPSSQTGGDIATFNGTSSTNNPIIGDSGISSTNPVFQSISVTSTTACTGSFTGLFLDSAGVIGFCNGGVESFKLTSNQLIGTNNSSVSVNLVSASFGLAAGNNTGLSDATIGVGVTVSSQNNSGAAASAGNVSITAGNGTGTGASNGGNVVLTAGTSTNGTAGNIKLASNLQSTGGGTPTCGTGCSSITAGSTNTRGSMVSGASVSAVTLNWNATLPNTPACVISDSNTTATADISAISTSSMTVSLASALSAVTIYWVCMQ